MKQKAIKRYPRMSKYLQFGDYTYVKMKIN